MMERTMRKVPFIDCIFRLYQVDPQKRSLGLAFCQKELRRLGEVYRHQLFIRLTSRRLSSPPSRRNEVI